MVNSAQELMADLLPSLVILGRPNVGKSTLFNRLTGTRRAIVTNEPGITRDRIYGRAEWRGRALEVVDTGGIVPDDKALIPQEILRQAHVAIKKAALLVLVVDSQAGLTPLDEELARLLRTTGKPFVIAVNKVDAMSQEVNAGVFHRLGVPIFPIAAEHGTGVDDLRQAQRRQIHAAEPHGRRRALHRLAYSWDHDGQRGHGNHARWPCVSLCGHGGDSPKGENHAGGGKT